MMMGRPGAGSARDASEIADWVEANFPAQTVGATVVYDLTQTPLTSQPAHSSGQR
jgi:hypothetical protein